MKVSQKGLYALEAMIMLAHHYRQGTVKIRDIAAEEHLPEKFLEIILIELKNARLVESTRGAKGGYQLRRDPSAIRISEIIRLIDGPLAPYGDADQLRGFMERDAPHRALYKVLLDVRDAAANVLDNTTVSDIAGLTISPEFGKPARKAKVAEESAPPRNGRSESEARRSRVLTLTGR
jgi:Rrf2 family protein